MLIGRGGIILDIFTPQQTTTWNEYSYHLLRIGLAFLIYKKSVFYMTIQATSQWLKSWKRSFFNVEKKIVTWICEQILMENHIYGNYNSLFHKRLS